ncbi:DUF4153 domain-containing protein, partial [Pedobacter sp.]|uniref:DUF4153 domain-containing protein n=1 Tax=Pedobacter sp. TaxID=1411316 RepID=UPI003D7F3CDC
MKLPSLASLGDEIKKVVFRFPLQVLVTLLACLVSFTLIDVKSNSEQQVQLLELLLQCNLGLVLLLAADLFAEVNHLTSLQKWALRLFCILLCTVLYFTLNPDVYIADRYRVALLVFAFHLLVAFAPFIKRGNLLGFWEYNKVLFIRILTSGLYSFVLYTGLGIALMAIHGLFNVKIDSKIYLYMLTVVGIGFNTLFFLAGIPADFKVLNEAPQPYPKGLKVFTQYVLIPLLSIYLLILLVYEVKIMIDWQLPKGMVSTLILGYAVFGVLSLLLIFPIKEQQGNGWIRLFSRWFYIMMIPLVVLLLLAVWRRVGVYGITESRYILVILALWLSIITAYFLISKKDNIKIIPISLCVLALLAAYGPQSAFSISRYSQTQRLRKMMKLTTPVAQREKPAIIRYLVLNHGLTSLQPFTTTNLDHINEAILKQTKSINSMSYLQEQRLVDTAFAILKVKEKDSYRRSTYVSLISKEEKTIGIKGYDYLIPLESGSTNFTTPVNGTTFKLKIEDDRKLVVKIGADQEVVFDPQPAVNDAHKA